MDDLARDSDVTNGDRAGWALHALRAFGTQTGQRYLEGVPAVVYEDFGDVFSEMIPDLICDLLHLGAASGLQSGALIASALMHFEAEAETETEDDDGERRCVDCDESFNLEEGGQSHNREAEGPLCLRCEDKWPAPEGGD
jgi:hypothetical protein